jgi:phosphate transport system permease protein
MSMRGPDATIAETRPQLGSQGRRWGEDGIKLLLLLCAALSIATTVGIIVALVQPAIEFFREVNFIDFITGTRWAPLFTPSSFGVLPLIASTFALTFWAALVFIPFGLGAAIYLSEYARPGVRRILKPALEILAGIPTVVFGFFALVFFTPLLQDFGLGLETFNILGAGLVIGVMLIPTVASISEDAMAAVPHDLRAGAYALGATRVHVATRVVVPAAFSGIIASYILAISRALGETVIALIAAGTIARITFNPEEGAASMAAFIAATGIGDVPTGSIEYKTIFAVGLTLFAFTLVMNIFSTRLVRRYREVYE